MSTSVCVIGCGTAFESITNDAAAYNVPNGFLVRKAENVAALSTSAANLLEGLTLADTSLFIAVDQNALNFARLELYGAARLRGFRMTTLIHARAWVAPDAQLGDNVWIAAGAIVNRKANIEPDVMVLAGARIDANVNIGKHSWIGGGASLGEGVHIGSHSVIGNDMRIRAGLSVGKYCVLDTLGVWNQDMADGSFISPQFDLPARLIGPSYSFTKSRS